MTPGEKPAAHGGPGAPRERGRGPQVVAQVLAATAEELGRVGYVGLRVEDVAQRAGVNKTTIYRRWPTKADLVSATLRREGEGRESPPDTGNLHDDLVILLRRFAQHGRSPMLRVLMAEMLHPEVQAIGNGLRHNFESRWITVVARGMGRGELPPDTSPRFIVELVTAPVVGRMLRGEEPPDPAFCDGVVRLVLAGAVALAGQSSSASSSARVIPPA